MQQGDVGAPIRFNLKDGAAPFPLPDGSVVELWILQPSRRLLRRVFEIVDPQLGQVYYETAPGDLAEWGRYRFQPRALLPDGSRIGFRPHDEDVFANAFPAPTAIFPPPAALRVLADEPSVG